MVKSLMEKSDKSKSQWIRPSLQSGRKKRPGIYQQGSHRGKPNSSPLQSLRKILPGLMSIMQLIIQGLEMCWGTKTEKKVFKLLKCDHYFFSGWSMLRKQRGKDQMKSITLPQGHLCALFTALHELECVYCDPLLFRCYVILIILIIDHLTF